MRKSLLAVLAALTVVLGQPAPVNAAAVPAPGVWVASAGLHRVTWAWTAVHGATEYKVVFSRHSDLSDPHYATTTKRTVTHTGLTAGSSYYLAVRAVTAGGRSARSRIAQGLAGAVPKPRGTAETSRAFVDWRWNPYAGAAKYLVQQSTTPTFRVNVVSRVVSVRSIALGVKRDSWGYLRVKPLNESGAKLTPYWSLIGAAYVGSPHVVVPTG